jgi:uncharacterized protein YceK
MKTLVLILSISVAMIGCAGLGTFTPGTQAVVDLVCSPTDQQKAEAAKWLAALDAIQAGASVAFPALAIMQASSVMKVVAAGGCFVLAEVQAALNLLSNMQVKQASFKSLKAQMSSHEQFPALWAAVERK